MIRLFCQMHGEPLRHLPELGIYACPEHDVCGSYVTEDDHATLPTARTDP